MSLRRPTMFLAMLLVAGRLAAQPNPDLELFQKSLRAAAEAMAAFGAVEDSEATARVSRLGYRVAQEARFDRFPISFYLVEMAEPNAFALPGGQIFVTRGMLELGLSDDQLAALLGHEIAHVVRDHGMRMERRATLLNILSQALLVGAMVGASQGERRDPRYGFDQYGYGQNPAGDGDQNLVIGTYAAGVILSELLLRSYSRDFETEADEEGQRWAAAAGFDPEGAAGLMTELGVRLPDSRDYGYWRTHPFFDLRIQGSRARARELATSMPRSSDDFRQRTQARLLDLATQLKPSEAPKPEGRGPGGPQRGGPVGEPLKAPIDDRTLVEAAALTAWPIGPAAERIRGDRLAAVRGRELERVSIGRDYGRLLAAYDREIAEVRSLTPASEFLTALATERATLAAERDALYPEAQRILAGGVYETPFLERFLSNFPEAGERPRVGLALGEAYARLGRHADAVAQFLAVDRMEVDPTFRDPAHRGLENLAPSLDALAALAELAAESRDPALAELARTRLDALASSYQSLANGAEFLRRFPETDLAPRVTARLNSLAENLYGEVVLYQGVGDHLKAIDRMQQILTHAPQSPAAARLLDRVVSVS